LTLKVDCRQIGEAIVIGDRRPYLVALVTLDADVAAVKAKEKVFPFFFLFQTTSTARTARTAHTACNACA
jgi:long-subunit acyl-CoA synthetase (AMP-forming)